MKLQKITKDKSRKQYRYIVCGGHANTFPDSFPFAQKESLGTKLNVEKCKKNVRKQHGGIGSHSTDPLFLSICKYNTIRCFQLNCPNFFLPLHNIYQQGYFQPEIARKIRLFRMGLKNNIRISYKKNKECLIHWLS